MAADKNNVKTLAREIYIQTVALFGGRVGKQSAVQSFKAAEEFLAIQADYESGAFVTSPEAQWGGDCYAPKLPPTHPLNLISAEQNDKSKGKNREIVNRISKWLVKNPDETVAYHDEHWSWTPDTTRVARQLFPAYADKDIFPALPKADA